MPLRIPRVGTAAITAIALLLPTAAPGEQVAVRFTEGLVHGFLALRSLDGTTLADGDLVQTVRGSRVTSRLTFHFKDGSLQDETSIYSQAGSFRLITDHLVQKGPSFPRPLEMTIDVAKKTTTVRYVDEGRPKVETGHFDLPPDLANGVILTLLKNARPNALPKSLSYVAATPQPRLVKLVVTNAGEVPFATGGEARTAIHYIIKVEIGGLAGLVAPLVGKQPPDSHVWILGGDAPAFVKAEQSLYADGPIWRIELVSPTWPR